MLCVLDSICIYHSLKSISLYLLWINIVMYKANSDVFGKMVQLVVSLFLELISVGRKKTDFFVKFMVPICLMIICLNHSKIQVSGTQ